MSEQTVTISLEVAQAALQAIKAHINLAMVVVGCDVADYFKTAKRGLETAVAAFGPESKPKEVEKP